MVERHERLRERPVHIVMPLSGRRERLEQFLRQLGDIVDQGELSRAQDTWASGLLVIDDDTQSTAPFPRCF